VVDEIAPSHVEHGAFGNKGAETDLLAKAPVEDGGAQSAALAYEAYIARQGHRTGEGGVEPGERPQHAQAVEPEKPQPLAASLFEDLPLQLITRFANLPKTGGDDYRPSRSGVGALAYYVWHGARRRGDDREIHRLWHSPTFG
jgi:hypothetical protein